MKKTILFIALISFIGLSCKKNEAENRLWYMVNVSSGGLKAEYLNTDNQTKEKIDIPTGAWYITFQAKSKADFFLTAKATDSTANLTIKTLYGIDQEELAFAFSEGKFAVATVEGKTK